MYLARQSVQYGRSGRGRSFCTGLSSSCVFLGSFLLPQRLSRLLWGCSPSLGPPGRGVLPAQHGLPHQFLPLASRLHSPSKPCFALSSLDTSPCPAPSVQASCNQHTCGNVPLSTFIFWASNKNTGYLSPSQILMMQTWAPSSSHYEPPEPEASWPQLSPPSTPSSVPLSVFPLSLLPVPPGWASLVKHGHRGLLCVAWKRLGATGRCCLTLQAKRQSLFWTWGDSGNKEQ